MQSSIKNRLKRLEVNDDSGICACFPQYVETYLQDLGADAKTNEPVLTSDAIPDVCPHCRKQIEKNVITVQLVDATTKDNFPEQWKNGNK